MRFNTDSEGPNDATNAHSPDDEDEAGLYIPRHGLAVEHVVVQGLPDATRWTVIDAVDGSRVAIASPV
jgi:hypothetical protein